MLIKHRDQLRPTDRELNLCSCVYVDGDKHKVKEVRDWARECCASLAWWETFDMSDISSWTGPDDCLAFYFTDQADAVIFKLRWC